MQECLFDGEWPKKSANRIECFCSCLCGAKTYLAGYRYMVVFNQGDTENPVTLAPIPCLTEISSTTGESINYMFEDELPGEYVDIYSLNGENVLCVIFCSQTSEQIIQLILKLNRETERVEYVMERRFAFKGVYLCRIGIGTVDAKQILIIGKSSPATGEVVVAKSIAANPFHISKYPDQCFDKEIAELEQLCKNHPKELMPFPNCVPFVNENGIYHLLGRIQDMTLALETEFIGSIRVTKTGTKVEIIPIQGKAAMDSVEKIIGRKDLNVGWCSYISQRKQIAWMSFMVQKSSGHWRFLLQRLALLGCSFLLKYIGFPLVKFSWLDGGLSAELFARFYLWLVPGFVPNLGPTPDLLLLALDLKTWQMKYIPFLGNESQFGSPQSTTMVDVTSAGDLMTIEAAAIQGRMRISCVKNPFKIPSLLQLAFETSSEIYPSKGLANLPLNNVYNCGGCLLFNH